MSDDNLSPELEETLDEHIRWVNQATELALTGAFLVHLRGDGPTPATPFDRPQAPLTFRKQHRRADTALENDQGALG